MGACTRVRKGVKFGGQLNINCKFQSKNVSFRANSHLVMYRISGSAEPSGLIVKKCPVPVEFFSNSGQKYTHHYRIGVASQMNLSLLKKFRFLCMFHSKKLSHRCCVQVGRSQFIWDTDSDTTRLFCIQSCVAIMYMPKVSGGNKLACQL